MSNQNLADGAFLTTLNGRRCTAVPRSDIPPVAAATAAADNANVQNNAQDQDQAPPPPPPQVTEAAGQTENVEIEEPPAASTAETPPPEQTVDAQAQAQAQEEQDAQRQAAAAQAPAPAPAPAPAGGRLGGALFGQQAADPVQAQAAGAPAAVVAQEEETPEAAAAADPPPPTAPSPPPSVETGVEEAAASPAAQNAQAGQDNPPIQAFTANENEAGNTQSPPSQTSQSPQGPAAGSSQTDNDIVPTTPSAEVGAAPSLETAATPEAVPEDGVAQGGPNANGANGNGNGNLVATIGLDTAGAGTAAADTAATDGANTGVMQNNAGGATGGAPTAVVAGSVIGGLAVVSLIAFLLWFWRKRVLRRRRSTLLTPLSVGPAFGRGNNNNGGNEKAYMIDRNSLGPTPKSTKFKAAVGANLKKVFGGRGEGTPSVNMNRGTSQFMDPPVQHSRSSSGMSSRGSSKSEVTGTDRFKDWWSRLTADVNFNWKLRNDRNAESDPFTAARDMKERKAAMGSQPDFLTLLGMDERDVQREADQRRQMNHVANQSNGSNGSTDHFLGGLNLNFDSANNSNPFSDSNALPHDSAKPAPLTVSQSNNPFSDDNAIRGAAATKPPTTYVAEVRKSRGQSLGGGGPGMGMGMGMRNSNAPFSPGVDSVYRESVQSVESFGTRRNKFRSDPFDLERPELLGQQDVTSSSNMSTAGSNVAPGTSSNGLPGRPSRAHHRADSFSSKYSSGMSLGDWSDPGPDVGPAGRRWDSPTEGWRPGEGSSRRSGGSQRSVGVGKAL